MHISNAQIHKIFDLHLHRVHGDAVSAPGPERRPDQLTLSRQATEMQNIRRFLEGLPEVRSDKVGQFRRMIRLDAYEASDYEIASAMFAAAGEGRIDG